MLRDSRHKQRSVTRDVPEHKRSIASYEAVTLGECVVSSSVNIVTASFSPHPKLALLDASAGPKLVADA